MCSLVFSCQCQNCFVQLLLIMVFIIFWFVNPDTARAMKVATPEISWYEREPIYSVDLQPISGNFQRLASCIGRIVRVWLGAIIVGLWVTASVSVCILVNIISIILCVCHTECMWPNAIRCAQKTGQMGKNQTNCFSWNSCIIHLEVGRLCSHVGGHFYIWFVWNNQYKSCFIFSQFVSVVLLVISVTEWNNHVMILFNQLPEQWPNSYRSMSMIIVSSLLGLISQANRGNTSDDL